MFGFVQWKVKGSDSGFVRWIGVVGIRDRVRSMGRESGSSPVDR